MAKSKEAKSAVTEIEAIKVVHDALKDLDAAVQGRVLRYVSEMLDISAPVLPVSMPTAISDPDSDKQPVQAAVPMATALSDAADADGISQVALKWMRRSNLNPTALQSLFSLGIDEIDLVANQIPGSGKRDRMRNVLLLKGIAAYLGTGVARISYEQLKEACLHYNAYDRPNFARYLKSFAADVGGTKDAEYTLTARGLNAATELIKGMLPAH
jgi:hypothetical protein